MHSVVQDRLTRYDDVCARCGHTREVHFAGQRCEQDGCECECFKFAAFAATNPTPRGETDR